MLMEQPKTYSQEEWDALTDEERETAIVQADRYRRSNRVLDLRVSDLEKRTYVNPQYVEYVYKQIRREMLYVWVCIILIDLSLLIHLWNTQAGIFAKESADA